ncbi:MAG: hypothetical protein QM774_04860 [Gordonia sp. (in: high G+C Gram-positive bacteria)]|uniref:phosphotransferase family protein n=1 Tax=Gordonia sp. (in: high G+C Gram-positive bacteria) TaxID=84139 RepID=UPI0039E703AA
MTVLADQILAEVLTVGEELLSRRAGAPVALSDPEDLGGSGRSTVIRARVSENTLTPDRTVVVKALGDGAPAGPFLREVAAYRYATALPSGSQPGPQLLAVDTDTRVLVLTDLGDGRSMVALLDEDADDAARGVSAWGQALGRMHAATLGGEGDFDALLRRTTGRYEPHGDEVARQAHAGVRAADRIADRLGIAVPERLAAELRAGAELFAEGDHRAFSPSDVGPENILLNDEGVQFMDYEHAAFRDAALDVAYALATFPVYLDESTVSHREELETSLVDAWRSEVQALWPDLGSDARVARQILAARTLWVWLSTYWMIEGGETGPGGQGSDWALHTGDARVVLTRWADLADAAQRAGDVELRDQAETLERALRVFWFD